MARLVIISPTSKFFVVSLVDEIVSTPILPFTDLTAFIAEGSIQALGEYLATKNLFSFDAKPQRAEFHRTTFAAAGRKHADEIKLQNQVGYGENTEWPKSSSFRDCRARRGSSEFWRHNSNASKLPDLVVFVDRLPFFKETGKVTIILSASGSQGVEHVDHKFDDLVSEFVWLRTGVGPSKRFFVRDADGEKRYVENVHTEGASSDVAEESDGRNYGERGICVWFDDHHVHNTESIDEPSYSIRIDGVFTDEFRAYICSVGVFSSAGLRSVLQGQQTKSHLSDAANASLKQAKAAAYTACSESYSRRCS